MDCLS